MVKIIRTDEPAKTAWIKAKYLPILEEAILSSNKVEKEVALSKYNHPETKSALISMQHKKCAYCEAPRLTDTQYGDIEHFQPKSIYPLRAFDWDNFLLSCIACNQKLKDDYDVGNCHPFKIVKPDVDDPNEFFEFVCDKDRLKGTFDFRVIPRKGLSPEKRIIALETINLFKLNEFDRVITRFSLIKSDFMYVKKVKELGIETLNEEEKLIYQAIQQPTQGYSAWLR